MQSFEPSLGWANGAVTTQGGNTVSVQVSANTATADTVFLSGYAKDGNCYIIEQTNDPAVTSGSTGYAIYKNHTCPAVTAVTTGAFKAVQPGAAANGTQNGATFYQTW
jgi:hypothetical protein